MSLRKEARDFLESWRAWGAAFVICGLFVVSCAGCATVFDAPVQAKPIANPDKTPAEWRVVCELLFDNVRWLMTVPVGECKGWARI